MKTKNLLVTGFLIITFSLMHQMTEAGGCSNKGCKNGLICYCQGHHCGCVAFPGFGKTDETFTETATVEEFSIYPNPASDKITLSVPSDEEAVLQIMNTMGQIIIEQKITTQAEIDVSAFHAGVYIARWSDGENKGTKMFTVTK
jgi:hypothetical protein